MIGVGRGEYWLDLLGPTGQLVRVVGLLCLRFPGVMTASIAQELEQVAL